MNECLICFEEMDVSKDRLYECNHCFKHIHISCYKDWKKQQMKIQLKNHNISILYNGEHYNENEHNQQLINNHNSLSNFHVIRKPINTCLHCQCESKFKELNNSCLSKIKKLFRINKKTNN